MDQLIARAAFLGSPGQILAVLPQSRPIIIAVLFILFVWSSILAILVLRSIRRQRTIEAELKELKAEVDRLHQADERRSLTELRSNQRFLDKITLEPQHDRARENSQ